MGENKFEELYAMLDASRAIVTAFARMIREDKLEVDGPTRCALYKRAYKLEKGFGDLQEMLWTAGSRTDDDNNGG